jgi:hypothetical protein
MAVPFVPAVPAHRLYTPTRDAYSTNITAWKHGIASGHVPFPEGRSKDVGFRSVPKSMPDDQPTYNNRNTGKLLIRDTMGDDADINEILKNPIAIAEKTSCNPVAFANEPPRGDTVPQIPTKHVPLQDSLPAYMNPMPMQPHMNGQGGSPGHGHGHEYGHGNGHGRDGNSKQPHALPNPSCNIRLEFSKNSLWVRDDQKSASVSSNITAGMSNLALSPQNGFATASGPPQGRTAPPSLGFERTTYQSLSGNWHQ